VELVSVEGQQELVLGVRVQQPERYTHPSFLSFLCSAPLLALVGLC
jgi:hypothetical protein